MIRITSQKLEELIKEKSKMNVCYMGKFVDNKGMFQKRFAFLNKSNNQLVGLDQEKLIKILSV